MTYSVYQILPVRKTFMGCTIAEYFFRYALRSSPKSTVERGLSVVDVKTCISLLTAVQSVGTRVLN